MSSLYDLAACMLMTDDYMIYIEAHNYMYAQYSTTVQ